MAFGPMQLMVIGFDSADPVQGQIKRELVHLYGRGIIRIVEGLAIAKQPDGRVAVFGAPQPPDVERENIEGVIAALIDMPGAVGAPGRDAGVMSGHSYTQHEFGLGRHDVEAIINGLAPGTAAALLLIEHTWALRLSDAFREVGGKLIALGFLTPDALRTVGAELQAIAEAESAFDLSNAMKGAALLEMLEAQAKASIVAAARKAAVASETLRVLILAGLVDDAAALDALDALVDAGLLDETFLLQAAQLAEQKAVQTDSALAAVEAVAQQT